MDTNIAYLAGLFDGEGTITLGKNSNPKAFRRVEITLSSTDKCLCNFVASILGFGSVYEKTARNSDKWAQAYEYRISGDNALKAALTILPYSKHPKKIARMKHVLAFHKAVTNRNGKYTPLQRDAKIAYEQEFFAL